MDQAVDLFSSCVDPYRHLATSELWGEVFEPLKDVREFAKLRADPEMQTLAWENGADLAPEFLYEQVEASKRVAAE